MQRSPFALLLAVLPGCAGCEPKPPLLPMVDPVSAEAVGVAIAGAVGGDTVQLPVYAVNEVGAAVPGEGIALASTGTLAAPTAAPDPLGWAVATLTASEPGSWAVDASVGGASASAIGTAAGGSVGQFAYPAITTSAASTRLAAAGNGIVWATDTQVWWAPGSGAGPCLVLDLPQPVEGMEAQNIDADGVIDLLVWTSGHAILLRGRQEGGLAWGAGWTPIQGSFAGAAAGDFDGDSVVDLLLAEGAGGAAYVAWMVGDGVWGFEHTSTVEMADPVYAVSGQDYDDDGEAEITVLVEGGGIDRWGRIEDEWLMVSDATYNLGFDSGARFLPSVDLTGDGEDDIVATGPLTDGSGWQASVVSAGAANPTQFNLYPTADPKPPALDVQVADLTGDGVQEAVLSEPGRIIRAGWNDPEGTFTLIGITEFPAATGLAVVDVTGDAVADVILGGSSVRVFPGAVDDETPWETAPSGAVSYNLGVESLPWFGDYNGDAIADAVMYLRDEGGLAIRAYYGDGEAADADETFRAGVRSDLGGTTSPLDLAVCGHDVYALIATESGNRLATFTLDDVAGLTAGAVIDVSGTMVACGAFAEGDAAVVTEAGGVEWIAGGAVVASEARGGSVGDVGAVDDDGDLLDALTTCEGECSLAVGDFDGDGADDLAVASDAGVQVTLAGTTHDLVGTGAVWAGDADGDGTDDLVVGDAGMATVRRGLGGVLSIPVSRYLARPVADAVAFGDLDGNGIPDAFYVGQDDDASDDVTWDGLLLYAESPDE